jgi:6-phosphogluconolactonase
MRCDARKRLQQDSGLARYRSHLESRQLAPGTVNLRLGAVRRLAYEAADCGLLSADLAAGIRRVKGVKKLGMRLGNWLTAEPRPRALASTRSSASERKARPSLTRFAPRVWVIVDEVKEEKRLRQLTRRGFIFGSAALSVAGRRGFALERFGGGRLLLVGTQTAATSKGIYAYSFEAATGELKELGLAGETDNPTFLALAPNGRTVIVANELDTFEGKSSGAVSSYALDRTHARLSKISEVASQGGGPCHVTFDHTGRSAFAANYGGGSAASFSVGADGRLSPAVSFFQYSGSGPDPARQKGPHAHRVTVSPDNRFLLVNDLGLDAIHIYRLDAATAKLTANEPAVWRSSPGAGPRALLFHPSGKFAYCVAEMTSSVIVLRWDAFSGSLETVQEVAMRPPDFQGTTGASDIVIDREARFAYAADRFDDIIATFSISPTDGRLTLVNQVSCAGKVPRHLTLDPTGRWLLVANQASDNIAVLSRDVRTGQLTAGKSFPLSKPQCLVFA